MNLFSQRRTAPSAGPRPATPRPAPPPGRERGPLVPLLCALATASWVACTGADAHITGGGAKGGPANGNRQPGEANAGGSAGAEGGAGEAAGGAAGGSAGDSAGGAGEAAGDAGAAGGGAGGSPPVGEGGLPCDVQSFLNAQCTSCHADPPRNGAPMALTSRGALLAVNGSGVSFAERALARLQEGTMPPGNALPAAEFEAFTAWVNAGAPEGSCVPVDDPFDDPPTCSSGRNAPFCDDDRVASLVPDDEDDDDDDCAGPEMNPGIACGNCHSAGGEGPRLWFGGTVYRTAHEPDRCVGGPASGQAQVVITDANGNAVSRSVNPAGNFVLLRGQLANLAFPIRAEVRYEGRVRAMATPQMTGDCNSCHTQDGANGAPGRIVLP
jgi:hypothetical protein